MIAALHSRLEPKSDTARSSTLVRRGGARTVRVPTRQLSRRPARARPSIPARVMTVTGPVSRCAAHPALTTTVLGRVGAGRCSRDPAGRSHIRSIGAAAATEPPVRAELSPLTRHPRHFGVAEDSSWIPQEEHGSGEHLTPRIDFFNRPAAAAAPGLHRRPPAARGFHRRRRRGQYLRAGQCLRAGHTVARAGPSRLERAGTRMVGCDIPAPTRPSTPSGRSTCAQRLSLWLWDCTSCPSPGPFPQRHGCSGCSVSSSPPWAVQDWRWVSTAHPLPGPRPRCWPD